MPSHLGAANPEHGKLYARAAQATRKYVGGIRPDQWTLSTPCSEWNVRQVLNHLVSEAFWAVELFNGKTIAQVGKRFDGDLLGKDPLAAYGQSTKQAAQAMQAPSAMAATCHLSYGDVPGAVYAGHLFVDALIHGWDIAKGAGQDTRLNVALVKASWATVEPQLTGFQGSGVFGTPVLVAKNADLQTKLLGALGRRP